MRRSVSRLATRNWPSGIASRIGMAFRLRRADLRILVGCGAAGGIAGAFGAPLAGAFLRLRTDHRRLFAEQPGASRRLRRCSATSSHMRWGRPRLALVAPEQMVVATHDLVIAAVIGLFALSAGILMMRGVAVCEALFVRVKSRLVLRTTIGGLLVGLLAIVAPQVMSSGHGALHFAGHAATVAGDRGAAVCAQDRSLDHLARLRAFAAACSSPRC